MPEENEREVQVLTLEQANALIPKVETMLRSLRAIEKQIVAKQAEVDLEELVGAKADGSLSESGKVSRSKKLNEYNLLVQQFYSVSEEMDKAGGVLKDVNKGLVDFYTLRDNELVFLCWVEGEKEIKYWHTLQDGFPGRQPI